MSTATSTTGAFAAGAPANSPGAPTDDDDAADKDDNEADRATVTRRFARRALAPVAPYMRSKSLMAAAVSVPRAANSGRKDPKSLSTPGSEKPWRRPKWVMMSWAGRE
jgi:hypothetical protein